MKTIFGVRRLVAVVSFLVIAAATQGIGEIRNFKVTTDRTIDATSLESIVQQAIERSGAKTNDEKAIAIYEYLHSTIFHWAYPTEAAPQSVGPLKVINVYGWGLCGGQHTVLKALYETAGWKCRYVGWPGHTTVEVNYDGQWHYFDVFLKCYYWTKDKTHVASQEEIAADPTIVTDAVKDGRAARQNLCCGDTMEDVVKGCKARKIVGDEKGWASVTWRDENYSPQLNLPAGAALRLDWKAEPNAFAITGKAPQHSCGTKDFRNDPVLGPITEHYGPRNWSDGKFEYAPDFAKPADVADISLTGAKAEDGKLKTASGAGVAVFKLSLPYAYVNAKLDAAFDGGNGKLFVSPDGGKTWATCQSGDISPLVKQKYDVWVKAEFASALTKLHLDAMVEHNRGAQPYLLNGKNKITVSCDSSSLPKGAALTVTYAYQEATVPDPRKRNRWDGQGIIYGETKTVTKTITAFPTTFEINVGGNTPPKMISLERAVQARR